MGKKYTLQPGSKLGPYECIRLIGKGGMGEVYEAYEASLDRKVAIKIIPRDLADKDPEIVRRFDSEGKVLAQLSHPNVVVVHSLGHAEGIHYLAMEFVDGPSLKQCIKERTFSIEEALPLFQQMLAGTEALHRSGIIHRDLKPANVIYRKDGSIKIVDMGIAKNMEDTNPDLTRVGEVVGSPMYMSPEVAFGETATTQSDIWGLGVIFYEMLTGINPFKGNSQAAILKKITGTDVDFPKEQLKTLPEEVIRIVKKMCARNTADRYGVIAEVERDIANLLNNWPQNESGAENFGIPSGTMKVSGGTKNTSLSAIQLQLQKTRFQPTIQIGEETSDPDESKMKFYSIIYLAVACLIGVVFFKYKDSFVKELTSSPPPVTLVETDKTTDTKPTYLTIKEPREQQVFWIDRGGAFTYEFVFSQTPPNYRLQISIDPKFSTVLYDKTSPTSPIKITELDPEQTYYTRIVYRSLGKLVASETIQFHLNLKQGPIAVYPIDGQNILFGPSAKANLFYVEWKKKPGILRYRLQVAKDLSFRDALIDKSVQANVASGLSLPPGNYFWRVRTVGDNSGEYWSNPESFSIAVKPNQVSFASKRPTPAPQAQTLPVTINTKSRAPKTPPRPPALSKARVSSVLYLKSGTGRSPANYSPSNPPVLSWQRSKNADAYNIQIANDERFESITLDTITNKTTFSWSDVVPGKFFWRVAGRNEDAGAGSFSSIGEIEALISPPEIDSNFKFPAKSDGRASGRIKWKKIPLATSYLIKVSSNSAFNAGVRTYKSDDDNYSLEVDGGGKHFVKVVAINEAGEAISQYSRVAVIKLEREKAIEIDIPIINVPNDGTTIVSYGGSSTPIVFDWQKTKSASSYLLQFSQEKSFKEIYYSEKIKENQLIFDKKLPTGKIYWRLRAERDSSTSPWTEPRYLEIPSKSE